MKLSLLNTFKLFPTLKIWLRMPAFTGWLSLSTGIVLAELFPVLKVHTLYNSAISYAILLLLFPALLCKKLSLRMVFFILLGYFLLTSQTQKEETFYSQMESIVTHHTGTSLWGKVISTPLLTKGRYSFLCAMERIATVQDTVYTQKKIVMCTSKYAPPSYGTILCHGTYRAPSRAANPHTFNEYTYFSAQGVWGRFSVDTLITLSAAPSYFESFALTVRKTVYQTIAHVQDNALQGILQAAFLGEKNNLTPKIKSIFREAGIYHLLAISGLHVAILISSLLLILQFIPLARATKISMAVFFIWCYLFFIGMIPSLFRAVIMATLILLSTLVQRKNHVINSLGIAGIAWLCMSPTSLFTPGYQLSFAATFGIITLYKVFENRDKPVHADSVFSFIINIIRGSFLVSLAGFIATAPVLIYHFGTVSLFGLIANIFAVLLMGLAMNSFFIGIVAQVLFEPLSILIMKVTQFLLSLITHIAGLAHFVPFASVELPVPHVEFFILYILGFIGVASVDKRHFRQYIVWAVSFLFLIAPLILLYHSTTAYSEIIFFSAKNQSLAGIRFPNKKIWFIGSFTGEIPHRVYSRVAHPWFRHFMIKEYDVLLSTAEGVNIIHTLDPFIVENKPNRVITCGEISDHQLKEDFNSFLREHNIDRIQAGTGWRFVPAPRCTCSVYWYQKDRPWYEETRPAILKIACNGTEVSFNDAVYTNSENSLHIENAVVSGHRLERVGSLGKSIKTRPAKSALSTKDDGAIRLRIYRDGTIKIKTQYSEYRAAF